MVGEREPASDTTIATVRYFRERGLTRLAILSSTDATGQEADRDWSWRRRCRKTGTSSTSPASTSTSTTSASSAQITRIKAANPQALMTWTVGPAFGTELHGIAEAGLDVPVYR